MTAAPRQQIPTLTDREIKVLALLAGHTSVDSTWTEADFAALSLAAADQAGASLVQQEAISLLLPATECERGGCNATPVRGTDWCAEHGEEAAEEHAFRRGAEIDARIDAARGH